MDEKIKTQNALTYCEKSKHKEECIIIDGYAYGNQKLDCMFMLETPTSKKTFAQCSANNDQIKELILFAARIKHSQ